MNKFSTIALASALSAAVSVPAFAGNGAPNGAHYNLNIIGQENPKKSEMKVDPDKEGGRHTIFVPLTNSGGVGTKIWLTEGPFKVLDGNGFDNDGAAFQLPQNNCEADTGDLPDDEQCENEADYTVWVRGLGKPGGHADIKTCYEDGGDTYCSTEIVTVTSNEGGKGGRNVKFTNVTRQLTTLCLDLDDGGSTCDVRVQLFEDENYEYYWDYYNQGLRLAQFRFYERP